MRAVIIDDSARVRSELRQQLSRLGWSVVGEGSNGLEALELVRDLKPDLVTLDIIMPEMDGIECYRLLRKVEQPPRCLLISVLASEPRVLAAFERDIYPTHFLKKPVIEKDLRERLDLILGMPPMPVPPPLEVMDAPQQELPPPPPSQG
jgi:two-component system, chemotaxis family, chemotaxis protein CheY